MSVTHIVGVDPGLVHTGVVRMKFDPQAHEIEVTHEAILGTDDAGVRDWIVRHEPDVTKAVWPEIFIEAYVPRSHFGSDPKMTEFVQKLRLRLPSAKVLNNTGVKQVVRRPLMELLGVWKFNTPTHHQDLRSAARIALYGMLKDPVHNELLSDVVRDHEHGKTWVVRT